MQRNNSYVLVIENCTISAWYLSKKITYLTLSCFVFSSLQLTIFFLHQTTNRKILISTSRCNCYFYILLYTYNFCHLK